MSAASANYDHAMHRWTAVLRRADGTERVVRPRHVVMATGVSGIPYVPSIPGLEEFSGEVLHSSVYREGSEYSGRNALVIGTGNSGHDVAQDLHSYGASVAIVQRSSTTVVDVEPTAQKIYALYSEGLLTADCDLILRDRTMVPADLIVLATGYQSQQELVRSRFGDAVADHVGPIWGFDDTGELRNMWKRTAQEGLLSTLAACRSHGPSRKFLALQIKACEEGLIGRAAPAVPRALTLTHPAPATAVE